MKKFGFFLVAISAVALGLYYTNTYVLRGRGLGSVRDKEIIQYLPQGSELNYPISVPGNFVLDTFADLESGKPRVLAFDPGGVLVTSLTDKGKVVALPDADNNGRADETVVILKGLDKPHGIAFDGGYLYVAETDRVVRYAYIPADFSAINPRVLFELPKGGRHFTRTIRIYGDKLFTSVGSSCDTCLEQDWRRAVMLTSNLDGSNIQVYAIGLRNSVFFAFNKAGWLWGTDMGRDNLGDDLPPDELNIISLGNDYGWPYCYGKNIRDSKFFSGEKLDYCSDTQETVYDFPAHVAPLGLVFINSAMFSAADQGDLLVALHGSWNSSTPVGYKIVKLSILGNSVVGMTDFLDGWLQGSEVLGRPVDLIFDKRGALYISDDKAGVIYRFAK